MDEDGKSPEEFYTIPEGSSLGKMLSRVHRNGLLARELKDLKKRVAPQENVTAPTKLIEVIETAFKLSLAPTPTDDFEARLDAATQREPQRLLTALHHFFDASISP